ncbi:DUF4234 domain-containing protein [Amycolatopsis cynarae]|uniref:DUF4234 domain-containing protein n=1 Tax=Amycolatopsis cynarae TaxID=2995223 RepID=A0ABY7B2B2_9PSEU|nr:DUF4234 domain-containing protein [Amycolatopsis sp. HUAS 11-8]WAL65368.1 DUF4234 domain-containing protein [Amycolatopsis sp. HUAS 11-8]
MTQPDPYQPVQQPSPTMAGQPASSVVGGQPVATGIAMKKRNPVAVWLLWPFLTLGIYSLVWYYKIHKEMAEFDRRRQVPVAGPMLVLLFLGWTVIAPLVSLYNCGTRIRNAQRAAGLQPTCSPVAGLLLMLVFGIGVLYYQSELNKVCDAGGVPEGQQVPLYV